MYINAGFYLTLRNLTLLLVGLATTSADPTETAAWRVYVSNEDSGTVSVIDPASRHAIQTIEVGQRPRGIRVSMDGERLYVAVSGSPKCPPWKDCTHVVSDRSKDAIVLVSTTTGEVLRRFQVGSDPEQFDILESMQLMIVANEDSGKVSVISLENGELIKELAVGDEPEGVRVSPDGDYALVTSEEDHEIYVIDTHSLTIVQSIAVNHRPRDIAFNSDGSKAYVSCEHGESVAVIDMASLTLARHIRLGPGTLPMGVQVSTDDQYLYVNTGRHSHLVRVHLVTDSRTAIPVRGRPWGLGMGMMGRQLFSANGPTNDVSVIDAQNLVEVARVPVGASPWGIAVGVVHSNINLQQSAPMRN